MKVIDLFGNIWGCGPNIARNWYDQVSQISLSFISNRIFQGFRTLDDIRTKAKLNPNQQVGLKYYDEFRERIPRDEVTEIEAVVGDLLKG